MTDAETLAAAGAPDDPGDELRAAALAAVARRHGRALFARFRRLGLDAHSAEDCVQDTWLRLLAAGDRYEHRPPLVARLARNVWADLCRRRRARPDLVSGPPPAEGAAPVRPAVDPAERLDLARALPALPEPMRAVVELSLRGGFGYREIAERLHIPVGTVKSRMYHAVRRLREAMDGD